MNVLHLNESGALTGGVEAYMAEVAPVLEARGHASHLVYFAKQAAAALMPASTYVPRAMTAAGLAAAKKALDAVIAATRADVAYVHAVYSPDLVEWVARRLPTVAYIHGPYPVCPGSARFLRRSERVCFHRPGLICLWQAQREGCCWGRNPWRHAQALQTVHSYRRAYTQVGQILVGSAYMQRILGEAGFARPISRLAPVLLSDQDFAPVPEPEPNLIVYAGRLVQEKGLGHLLRALALVKGPWRLEVAGDGPLTAQYQALARQLKIADRVLFHGWVGPAAMRAVLGRSCLVVVPSLWPEPFGRMGAEAFVCGRPLVAYAVGGVTDWLEHQTTGLLVAPGDIAGLAQGVEQLLADPRRCRQMGQQARDYAWQRWRRAQHVDEVLTHFEACRSVGPAGH